MSKLIVNTIVAAALVGGTAAYAQSTVVLTPDGRAYIERYVVEHPMPPVAVSPGVPVVVGEVLPPEVELYAIEGAPGTVQYRYVVVDNQTLVVDPVTREIVEVLY